MQALMMSSKTSEAKVKSQIVSLAFRIRDPLVQSLDVGTTDSIMSPRTLF